MTSSPSNPARSSACCLRRLKKVAHRTENLVEDVRHHAFLEAALERGPELHDQPRRLRRGYGGRCCQTVSRSANGKLCQNLPFQARSANDVLWSTPARIADRQQLGVKNWLLRVLNGSGAEGPLCACGGNSGLVPLATFRHHFAALGTAPSACKLPPNRTNPQHLSHGNVKV